MGILERLSQRIKDVVDDLAGPEELREQLQRGTRALDAGAYREAERELGELVTKDAASARGWHLLGLAQLRSGQPAAAVASLERARALRPEEFAVLVALAEAQRGAGQDAAAAQSYKQALQVRVDESLLDQVFAGLGELHLAHGDYDHAVRELRKAAAVARGEDLRLIGRLGIAQYRAGDLALAQASLARGASAVPLDPEVGLLLSRVLLDLGRAEEARLAAVRLLQEVGAGEREGRGGPRAAAARCALARALLELRQPAQARDELLRALGDDPRCGEAHLLLGRVHAGAGDPLSAIRHLRSAEGLGEGSRELLGELLELELEFERAPELGADADRLLERSPEDPLGLAARAIALLATAPGDPSGLSGAPTPTGPDEARRAEAQALLARSLGERETFAGRLGRGLLHLGAAAHAEAAVDLAAALRLRPGSRRAEALLARAHRGLARLDQLPGDGADLYPVIRRAHELFLGEPTLTGLAGEVARIKEIFDRPLLVTVMGEFNSGKSTFVNALIGERVAPMGVVPTTATINVLKYGARRAARVIWRDDREQVLEWSEVEAFLTGLDRGRAREIRLVELLFPSEELLRVNVVDTPGLNSMIDEHEETAREYMAEADAVIWLFSAHQAGKQTEEQALEVIGQHRLKTIGVLNKIERLTPEELAQIEGHLRAAFGELTEAIVPVSARQALEALLEGSQEALTASRFPALRALLEERLFARGRAIKREAAQRRLAGVLQQASTQARAALEQVDRAAAALDDLAREVEALLPASAMEDERRALQLALQAVYRRGAEEVLDFVRPRRWALGEHRASSADRDFLIELLQSGLRGMTEASRERMTALLERAARRLEERLAEAPPTLPRLPPGSLGQLVEERLALLEEQVYTRYTAFARGYLLGGRVDHFFSYRLPRIDLALEPIYEALSLDAVDLERELLTPLGAWYEGAAAALARQLRALRQERRLQRLELEHRVVAPLRHLEQLRPAPAGGEPPGS